MRTNQFSVTFDDLHEHLALIAPRAVMVITALNDCGYAEAEADTMRAAFANLDENVARGHGFLEEERAGAYDFLDERLKNERKRHEAYEA